MRVLLLLFVVSCYGCNALQEARSDLQPINNTEGMTHADKVTYIGNLNLAKQCFEKYRYYFQMRNQEGKFSRVLADRYQDLFLPNAKVWNDLRTGASNSVDIVDYVAQVDRHLPSGIIAKISEQYFITEIYDKKSFDYFVESKDTPQERYCFKFLFQKTIRNFIDERGNEIYPDAPRKLDLQMVIEVKTARKTARIANIFTYSDTTQ